MLSLSILQKFDSEADSREQGRQLAAARIQSLFRMSSMREVYRAVQQAVAQEVYNVGAKSKKLAEERERLEKAEEAERKMFLEEVAANKLEGDVAVIYQVAGSMLAAIKPSSIKESRILKEKLRKPPSYEFDINIFFSNSVLSILVYFYFDLSN